MTIVMEFITPWRICTLDGDPAADRQVMRVVSFVNALFRRVKELGRNMILSNEI